MSDVRFLLGADAAEALAAVLARSAALPAWAPFDARAVAFAGALSRRLLGHPRIREFPELAAFAHWCRPARLRALARQHDVDGDFALRGRGLAFHLAPANVDSVAMYSWLLALLAGNANWVRVSQKPSAQLDFMCQLLQQVLAEEAGQGVAGRLVLLTYAHDAGITATISAAAMLRVVWGGDATVAAIRAIPLRPTAMEICFPDRFSAAALQAAALLRLDGPGMAALASAFCNDALMFAQQACSSPRLLAWVGEAQAIAAARTRFWAALEHELRRRRAENTPAMAMARLGASFDLAAAGLARPADAQGPGGFPTRLAAEAPLNATMKALHGGNGLFLEQTVNALSELAPQLSDKEQTLSVFGFAREELLRFVDGLPPRAIDRIVPVGQALSFAPTWDGADLLALFTRRIALPPVAHALNPRLSA